MLPATEHVSKDCVWFMPQKLDYGLQQQKERIGAVTLISVGGSEIKFVPIKMSPI